MINKLEYAKRQTSLSESMSPNSLLVLFSAKPKSRSNDTEYPYRQNSNFYYLTGFKEDNSIFVIKKEEKEFKTYLFTQKKDKTTELWTGKRVGEKKVQQIVAVDFAFSVDNYESKISEFIKSSKNVYFDFGVKDERIENLRYLSRHFESCFNVAPIIGKLRLIKSEGEIKLIKKAISITKQAHHTAMQMSKKLKHEYGLQAEIEYVFKKNGSYSDAYTSIVACGNSANTLHYISNDKKLENNKLILIDAGCEYEYYASDITRTIPVNGKFTDAHKELYSMVLDVEKEIISMIKPGVLRTSLQTKAEKLLCEGMLRLGILKGEVKECLKNKAHKKYYPHGIGHWMGLDVHDECPYKEKDGMEIPLNTGMVMTIEPGIYIGKNDKNVPKKYRGVGIRIEDDILVTKEGYDNLSQDIVKEIDDIENI